MHIFHVIGNIFRDAFDGKSYAILILVLVFLLLISFIRRQFSVGENKELLEKNKDLNTRLMESDLKLKTANQKLKNAQAFVIKKNNEIERLTNSQDKLLLEVQKLDDIRKNYSELYYQHNQLKQTNKSKVKQLNSFHLSPHLLKNLLNNAFLGAKVSFSSSKAKASFSLFGKKFHSIEDLEKIIRTHNKKLDTNIQLLVDTINYLIYGIQAQTVHIDTEIIQLEKFCKLISITKGIEIIFSTKIVGSTLQVPPTLLFNYIDNAVKHGYFGHDKTLLVDLSFTNNCFKYKVTTPIHPQSFANKALGGTGNQSMNEILDYYTKNEYNLSSEIQDNKYIAKLQLTL